VADSDLVVQPGPEYGDFVLDEDWVAGCRPGECVLLSTLMLTVHSTELRRKLDGKYLDSDCPCARVGVFLRDPEVRLLDSHGTLAESIRSEVSAGVSSSLAAMPRRGAQGGYGFISDHLMEEACTLPCPTIKESGRVRTTTRGLVRTHDGGVASFTLELTITLTLVMFLWRDPTAFYWPLPLPPPADPTPRPPRPVTPTPPPPTPVTPLPPGQLPPPRVRPVTPIPGSPTSAALAPPLVREHSRTVEGEPGNGGGGARRSPCCTGPGRR
jgi:hypothetical protein